jgi:uncharacterized membrane protein YgcG
MHRKQFAAVLCTTLLMVACTDAERSVSPVAPRVSVNAAANATRDSLQQANAERDALQQLTRMVALALQDPGLRQRVKADMHASRFTHEHKLPFSSYLHGRSGGILLAKMVKESGKSREEVLALLGVVRPLEFYMPVRTQRESWRGGENLLVGSLLEDHEVPMVYTLQGQPVQVGAEEEPALPALALVPVEANFNRSLDAHYHNRNDQGGATIGTLAFCENEGLSVDAGLDSGDGGSCGGTSFGGGGGPIGGGTTDPWASRATGLYVTSLNIDGDYEGAFKGDPEFEIHLQAPVGNPSVAEDIRCAGNQAPDYRSRFDYNNNGTTYSGAILVADSAEQARFRATYGTTVGMNVIFWEDDDTDCAIKADEDRFMNMMNTIASNYENVFAAIQVENVNFDNYKTIVKALPGLKNIISAVASWITTNDDLVGSAVEMSCSRVYSTFNYAIKDGTTTKGCVQLKAHDQAAY